MVRYTKRYGRLRHPSCCSVRVQRWKWRILSSALSLLTVHSPEKNGRVGGFSRNELCAMGLVFTLPCFGFPTIQAVFGRPTSSLSTTRPSSEAVSRGGGIERVTTEATTRVGKLEAEISALSRDVQAAECLVQQGSRLRSDVHCILDDGSPSADVLHHHSTVQRCKKHSCLGK